MSYSSIVKHPVLFFFVTASLALGHWTTGPLSHLVYAQVPHLIRYQGQAVDSKGVPLEGPYTLTFRLYDAQTSGTKLWEEPQPNVPLTGGHFSVLLGQVTPLTMDWSVPCWLSVQVNTEPELGPRQQITSVPLAMRAETAEKLAVPASTSTITDDANRLVPSGAIILWTKASCPAGYTRLSSLDGKFLVSAASFNPAAGGSNTHDHGGTTGSHVLTIPEMPVHSHYAFGEINAGWPFGTVGSQNNMGSSGGTDNDNYFYRTSSEGGNQGHTHSIAPADSRPEFATVLLCQKD